MNSVVAAPVPANDTKKKWNYKEIIHINIILYIYII